MQLSDPDARLIPFAYLWVLSLPLIVLFPTVFKLELPNNLIASCKVGAVSDSVEAALITLPWMVE